ncbi:hypothetical protein GCM10007103_21590 [Salinimicrobium marinum]|uniref:Uncharacterized protein n=1 Tax=Salinimicrobium marinum TaxID=680283 RepID=A0A918SI64_9FLAO|nr:hypothetical protein GCM10007103_21590 [Salinimicrobium marinum]
MKPIPSEYNVVPQNQEQITASSLGNGKVLLYNGANFLHTMDNTARINIWIDDKALGQLRPGEYVVIDLDNQQYNIELLHLDAVKMRSRHSLEVNEDTKVIMVKPTVTSNKLEVTNVLPNNFDKFTFMMNR